MDPLAERLSRLRAHRREAGWADELLSLGRELTMAAAGAVLARGAAGWETLAAPVTTGDPPPAWIALAEDAANGRVIAAAATGAQGRWCFAVSLGPAEPSAMPPRPAVLLLEVASALSMDLVLTRERMAFLGALAEAGGTEATLLARMPQALATLVGETFAKAADLPRGLHDAAAILAQAGLPGAERVALVLPRSRAVALSDQTGTERGAELPRRLLSLAHEAIDRGAPRLAVPGESPTPAERAFADSNGPRPLLIAPSPQGDAVVIAVFPPGTALTAQAAERLVPTASLLGRLARVPRRRGFAPGRMTVIAAVAAVVGVLAVLPRAATVEAPVVLRPEHVQAVTAPFDGILEASSVQPGDEVASGTTRLARLATREVELELSSARARAANDLRDAAVARAGGQPAQEQISMLSARRTEAQVALLEHRVRLADIRAPTDGTILSGDLRRSLGQPLTRGQVLFEIALAGPLRAEVLVLDEDSATIREGQQIRFSTASEPGRVRTAVVERLRPLSEVVQGRNVFRVIAKLTETDTDGLRPGMEGWARVEVGSTTWLASLLRDPIRWVRRQLWI